MNEILPALEGLQSWLSSVSLAGLFGLALRHWLASRRLSMTERKENREGYGALIEALERDVKAVREELAATKRNHADCETRMDTFRAEIADLHRLLVTLSLQHGFPLEGISPTVAIQAG